MLVRQLQVELVCCSDCYCIFSVLVPISFTTFNFTLGFELFITKEILLLKLVAILKVQRSCYSSYAYCSSNNEGF